MDPAFVYVGAALLSFAGMGVVHKLGDRADCRPLLVVLLAMTVAGVGSLVRAVGDDPGAVAGVPFVVVFLAVPFGVAAAGALWLFQKSLPLGPIVTSWLIVNLSAAVPTFLSVVVYGDTFDRKKQLAVGLMAACMTLLWVDRRRAAPPSPAAPEAAV